MANWLSDFFNSPAGQGIQIGLGGLAGAMPQTTSMQGSGSSSTNQSQDSQTASTTTGATNTQLDLNTLLNTINSIIGSTSQTTTPNLSPETQNLISNLTSRYMSLQRPSLTGYTAQQTQNINNNANLQKQALDNIMASRGLATSPVSGTAQAGVEAQRIGNITNLQQSVPLMQNQLDLSNMGAAANFMSMIPHGTTTTGTSTQQQTGQQTGQQSQTGVTNMAQNTGTSAHSEGASNTQQQQQQQQKSGGGIGGLVGGIGGIIASLFSDARLKHDIKPLEGRAVDKIMALRPVKWKWNGGSTEDAGFLAQDVRRVLPQAVHKDNESDLLKVNYAAIIPLLVKSVQELKGEVEVH